MKEIERLIEKLELDKKILLETEAAAAFADEAGTHAAREYKERSQG